MYFKFEVNLEELSEICFPGSVFWSGFCSTKRNITFLERFDNGIQSVIEEYKKEDTTDYITSGQIVGKYCVRYRSHSGRVYHISEMEDDLKEFGYAILQFHSTPGEDRKKLVPQVAERLIANNNNKL